MHFKHLIIGAFVAVGAASAASAAVVDLTDESSYTYIPNTEATGTIYSGSWSLTGTPDNSLTRTKYDGNFFGDLAFENDGIGIVDDEVTNPGEVMTLSFSNATTVTGFYFLDLYKAAGGASFEYVDLWVDGGYVTSFNAIQNDQANGGYGFFGGSWYGSDFTFYAGGTNDLRGDPDFALAGFQVVPVPAAGFLLLGGLGGLAALRRKKKAA